MKDIVVVALVTLSFAWLVTVHIATIVGLAQRPPRWHAAAAFFVPVLAPYWAWREQMKKRAAMWIGGVVVYLVALLLASH